MERTKAKKIADKILKIPHEEAIVCGSYRRECEQCGDVDIVMRPNDKTLPELRKKGFTGEMHLTATIDEEHVDVYLVYGAIDPMIMFLTGSQNHNIMMRARAKRLGYKLNQYGLYKDSDLVSTNEYDIYEILEIPYVEPKWRF